jgi:ABC-2 type transport system ATP-binding protein
MALLNLAGVSKRFGSTQALQAVSCAIDGRTVGLLGPNGSGKTTLMRVLLGLIAPDAGAVEVLGVDARREPTEVRSLLGYAAEGPGRMPGLSGLESVAYAAELCGMRRRPALLRAHDMLDLVGLDESRYRPVETYSTGMHQRIKVAMALVHDPKMLLLDEPTSGLDPQSRDELLDLIVHLRESGGPAVMLSTHLLHDVERTCDACIIMQEGQVRFSGPLSDLRIERTGAYTVRLALPTPQFKGALEAHGLLVHSHERDELFQLTVPAHLEPNAVWAIATASDAVIVHFEPRAASLEEAFLGAIGGTR